jgi:cytochrome c553
MSGNAFRRRCATQIKRAVCVSAMLLMSAIAAHAEGVQQRVKELTTQRCAACHGVDGNSTDGPYPRLAGQYPEYLFKQLMQFKGGPGVKPLRHSDVMHAMVEDLSPDEMQALAAYYAAQKPAYGAAAHDALLEAGKAVFTQGGAGGAPACIACHRQNGGGIEPDFPRIGGQHALYIEAQLRAWKSGARGGKGKLMSLIVPLLSDDEIAAVAAYVSSLQP